MTILQLIVGVICFALLGGFKDLKKPSKRSNTRKVIKKQPYSEEEMDLYNLEEWQRKLVREGRYAPWGFKKKSTSDSKLDSGQYYKDDSDR